MIDTYYDVFLSGCGKLSLSNFLQICIIFSLENYLQLAEYFQKPKLVKTENTAIKMYQIITFSHFILQYTDIQNNCTVFDLSKNKCKKPK